MPESRNNNVAITLFVICFEARILSSLTVLVEGIIYLLLYNMHGFNFKCFLRVLR